MRYTYKILMNYVIGKLEKEEMINYLGILGLSPKIIKEENDDIIFELETPANRPDLLSFVGVLREIMPFGNFNLKDINKTSYVEEIPDVMPIEIENLDDCFYYSCRIIKDIKNIPSENGFKKIIEDIGFKSSFNVVDISNFVMCEIGQPIHIFDLDKIKGKIIVRKGKKGEKIVTIDGKEREVEDVLLIADEEKPIAIAGIMGGANTEVSYQTKNILIESAYFNPVVIRKGSKKIGLVTEASLRFEKNLSISLAKRGMERVTEMIKEICGGEIGSISFKGLKLEKEEKEICLKKENVEKILGIKIGDEFLRRIFDKLEFKIKNEDEKIFLLKIPDFRKDINEEIDIIEEIAKYKKYSDIPEEMPVINIQPTLVFSRYETTKKIKHLLVNLGFSEIITLSFISDKIVEKFNLNAVKIENPLSQSFSFLRNTLIFNIFEVIKYNISHQNEKLEIFEIGKIYKEENGEFEEDDSLLIVSYNLSSFFDFKGKIEMLFEKCGLENIDYMKNENFFAQSGTNYDIYYLQDKVGGIFLASEELKNFFDIKKDVYVCEILFDKFMKYINFEKKFKQLPKFPSSKRDFSFLLDKEINWEEIEKEIRNLKLPLESIEVFDIYKDKNIPENQISVSFSVIFRSTEKTLQNEEIDDFSKKIIETIEKKFNGKLRGQYV